MTTRDGVAEVRVPSGTVTFLFSDIEGSTQRWDCDRAAMQAAVRFHDQLMRAAIAAHDGYVFKTIGDAFCVAFAKPESAALAALEAQRALGATDFSAVAGLRVRMAINTGTADERDGDYFGPTLNRVARLLSLGHGGQVLLSGIAAGLVRDNPPPKATLADLGAHSLKDLEGHEQVYQLVTPGLQRDFPELRARKELGPWLVPSAMQTRYFTGRDALLALVRGQLSQRHRAALCGLGGVGKTQAAIEYAIRHRSEYPDGVFWVNAETASGLSIGFVEIAKTLRLAAADSNDDTHIVKAVLDWLNGTGHWLLILDNVVDRGDAQRFMPERGNGDVLITSRESAFGSLGIPRALEVRDFESDEAVRYLLTRTGRQDGKPGEIAAATQLAAELGNLPLALEQAAAYIAETNAAFSDYLSAFRKRRVALLEKSGGLISRDTVAVTWAANFESVERASPAAAEVLRISAFLAPDAIPFEVFSKGAHALGGPIEEAVSDSDDLAMAELLRPLARYSLIRSDGGSRAYSVHRLVQEIVRAAIGEPKRRSYVEKAVAALDVAFPGVEFANRAQSERLVPHVESIARWVASCDVPAEASGRLLNQTGSYLIERGRYQEAELLIERALAIRERSLGPDHLDVASSLNDLARVLSLRGRFDDAISLHERALAIRERELGPDHPEVATSLNNLASVYLSQSRYTDAQPLFERALAIRERSLERDHPHVAHVLNNLAINYWELGRREEAESLFERTLASRERALEPGHPDVAMSINNLAHVYEYQGRYADAQPLLERALANWERALGADHPSVATSLDNLANVHLKQGRYAEAERFYERSLSIRRRVQGDHPDTAYSLVGLASLRRDQGRNAEAIELLELALAIKERTVAADHPELAQIRINLEELRAMTSPAANPPVEQ